MNLCNAPSNFRSHRVGLLLRAAALLPITLAGGSALAAAAPPTLINAPIDESSLVTLPGNTRPEAIGANDLGVVADSLPIQHMQLLLRRSPEQAQALDRVIDALHDPRSPSYHQWLSAVDFGRTYGLAPADIRAVTAWLQGHGFRVNGVATGAATVDFSGTAGAVRDAFHTEIHRLRVKGARHIANMSNPKIPAALAPAIAGIVSLHDFRPRAQYRRVQPTYTFSQSGQTDYYLTPSDLATIYNFNPVFAGGVTGKGQTIALVEDSDVYSAQDWAAFRATFGLSGYADGRLVQLHPAQAGVAGNCTDPGVNADDIEAILDAEWASAGAPDATIELAACADTTTTFGGLIALQNLINAPAPPAIVSVSFGECEAFNGATANAAYSAAYQQATAEGVSVFVAAGDEGAAGCDPVLNAAYNGIAVNGFASTAYNVAVGGTDFDDTAANTNSSYWNATNFLGFSSAKSYIPEIPWNDSCAGSIFLHYTGVSAGYGVNGLCNSTLATQVPIDSTAAGSGGPSNCVTGTPAGTQQITGPGTCAGAPKPAWQSGVAGLPNDGVRDLPDVSLFAANGFWNHAYLVCYSDIANNGASCSAPPNLWVALGGTSAATPILAGVQALINQKTGARQGNPNYTLYRLAASEYGAGGSASCDSSLGNQVGANCVFHDVTQGDNVVNCYGPFDCFGSDSNDYGVLSTSSASNLRAYGAETGWDFATGIGTVNVANLVSAWSGN